MCTYICTHVRTYVCTCVVWLSRPHLTIPSCVCLLLLDGVCLDVRSYVHMWVLWALLRTCTVAICSTYVHQVGYNLTSVAVSEGLLFMCNLISCTFVGVCQLPGCQSIIHGTLAQEIHNHIVHWLASSATTPAELVLSIESAHTRLTGSLGTVQERWVTNSRGMALCRHSTMEGSMLRRPGCVCDAESAQCMGLCIYSA